MSIFKITLVVTGERLVRLQFRLKEILRVHTPSQTNLKASYSTEAEGETQNMKAWENKGKAIR